jgi:DNA gyrase subunit A
MATNLAPHNLSEVCNALLLVIDDPNCGFKDILKVLPGPDFPTGGIICGRRGILDAYTTGKGHLTIRANANIETTKKGKTSIVVTEIPYMVVKTTIVSKIADFVQNNKLSEVADIRDESDRHGLRIVIDLKKEADGEVVLNKLYRYTPLQSTFAIANIALVNNKPETLNIRQLLDYFIDHRKEVIRRRSRFLLKRCRTRAHILEGLILAVSDIDEIIELIKKSPDTPTAKLNLMKRPLRLTESATLRKMLPKAFVKEKSKTRHFLTGPQADAILTMQLQRLTGLEIEKLAKEYSELMEQIEGYEAVLADESILLDIIREDIHEMKEKYGDERRTKITAKAELLSIEDLIAEEEVIVTVSHSGYIKRMPVDTYRRQARGGKGIIGSDTKEGDFIEHLFTASTLDYLLIFTNRGKCYWLRVYSVPSMARQSKGRSIANLLNLGNQEIASIISVRSFEADSKTGVERQLIMATKNGVVKKTRLSAYSNPRSTGVIAINLDPDDDLIGVALTTGRDHIVLGTQDGMTIRFDEGQVRSMGRASRGVRGIRLRPKDAVVGMVIAEEKAALLTVCERGYGKRTGLDNYRPQSRGGIGLKNIKTTERNGKVVALKAVQSKDDIMLITANGIIIRTGLEQMRSIGRNTQGVRLIKLNPSDKLVAAEKIVYEDISAPTEKVRTSQQPQSQPEQQPNSSPKTEAKPKSVPKAKAKLKPRPKPVHKSKSKSKSVPKAKTKKSGKNKRKSR